LSLKDHWLGLRSNLQKKFDFDKEKPDEGIVEKVKLLSEIIPPELMLKYKEITAIIKNKTEATKDHPEREAVDPEDEELNDKIDEWINGLAEAIKTKNEFDFNETDFNELEADCRLYFDALVNVSNAHSIERDINDIFKKNNYSQLDHKEKEKSWAEAVKQIGDKYRLSEAEAMIMLGLVKGEGADEYNLRKLTDTISQVWREYNVGKDKKQLGKISLGYLLAKGSESLAPYLFKDIISDDKFRAEVFLEFGGLLTFSNYMKAKTGVELMDLLEDLSLQINERVTNSIFFREFEFIHDKSLGEIYTTLERGKNATSRLIEKTISELVPNSAGILMSLGFLTKINPALGAIGLANLPVIYRIAKKQNKEIWDMNKKEIEQQVAAGNRMEAVKTGFEEVKTSSDTPNIAKDFKEQMDIKSQTSFAIARKKIMNDFYRMLPFDIAQGVSAGVGGVMQYMGMISGGAVLSNIFYSSKMNYPMQNLTSLYFSEFAGYVQDIEKMNKILGEYEKLDMPDGEKERARVSAGDLENYDIKIENLSYKNILKNMNLEFKEGEFAVIAGETGAGKSTLMRHMVGLFKPQKGSVNIGGVEVDNIKKYGPESLYSMISYSNQSPQIFKDMTVRENLLLWSSREVGDESIMKVLDDLHLEKFKDKLDEKLTYMSGGEKVRLGVARSLLKQPKIMFLDEPTASLDSKSASEARKILSEIREKYPNTTVICVSHDEKLMEMADRKVFVGLENKKPRTE
jgi:ABC-type bacteriocin/lantibiotic exporter with double-glycine peptidase domain